MLKCNLPLVLFCRWKQHKGRSLANLIIEISFFFLIFSVIILLFLVSSSVQMGPDDYLMFSCTWNTKSSKHLLCVLRMNFIICRKAISLVGS